MSTSPATLPVPNHVEQSAAVFWWYARSYRRAWRATITTGLLNPIFFLLSMGILLGELVDDNNADLGGLTYLEFVAPGLIAALAMQIGTNEGSFPVAAGIRWAKTYHAVVATPVRVHELFSGLLSWAAARIFAAAALFAGVAAIAGSFLSPLAALTPFAAVLCGLAFAAPMAALAGGVENHAALTAVFRFLLLPIFLFSGTFFPIERLPDWLEPVAWATPLWHGVELCRDLSTGDLETLPTLGTRRLSGRDHARKLGAGRSPHLTKAAGVSTVAAPPPRRGIPLWGPLAGRLVYRNVVVGRRAWLLVLSGFFEPVFFLLGIGLGVGALVGDVSYGGELVPYKEFVAPAMLAASAMNGAVYESTINVFAKLKWMKTYDGVLATPLGIRDVALGELIYALMRGAIYAVGFVVVMLAMGLVESWWAVLAVPAAILVGAAFAALGLIGVTFMRSWPDFAMIELVSLPLFLFSATFVPLSDYPAAAQWIVPLTPLYHGVELLRALTLGTVGWATLGHVAYLAVMTVVGLAIADGRLEKLLLK